MKKQAPVSSRILSCKWQEREHDMHRIRLERMQPCVSNAAPPKFKHLYTKPKKVQL